MEYHDRKTSDLLVYRDLISETSDFAVGLRASQRFCVNYFSGSHFNEWRSAEKDLRMAFDEDAVVRQCWMVRATRGRRAEYYRARLLPKLTSSSQVAKDLSSRVEDLELSRKEHTRLNCSCVSESV